MAHADRVHLEAVFTQAVTGELAELPARVQVVERDRKPHGTHLLPQHDLEALQQRRRAKEPEMISGLERRREEGQALDVIPVGVTEEQVARNRAPLGAVDERAPQLAN